MNYSDTPINITASRYPVSETFTTPWLDTGNLSKQPMAKFRIGGHE